MPKYHNRKVTIDGRTFDSAKEARRYRELILLERAGAITGLQMQVPVELIPAQRIGGRVVERSVKYVADFVYMDVSSGQLVYEDAKGVCTKEYIIKRKLALYMRGIRIKEV